MSDRTSRISTLDRVISYFSPTFGIKRIRAKTAIDAFAYGGGGYTGAKTRHGLSNTVSVGNDTDHSLSQLRSYSRSLVTYTTIGAGAVFLNASNTIGSGLKMQPSIVEGLVPLSKMQIKALQTQIKQRWKLWAESTDCDYNGQFTFSQLQFPIYLSKLTMREAVLNAIIHNLCKALHKRCYGKFLVMESVVIKLHKASEKTNSTFHNLQRKIKGLFSTARGKIKCTEKKQGNEKVPRASATLGLPQLNGSEDTMGRTKLIIENRGRHTHFTWEQRLQLQYHHNGTNGYEKTPDRFDPGTMHGYYALLRSARPDPHRTKPYILRGKKP